MLTLAKTNKTLQYSNMESGQSGTKPSELKHFDVAIIGAGPVGLFAVFELGLLGLSAVVIDVLDRPGGQCTELYPDKPIYDIPGYPRIDGQELVDNLMQQIAPFNANFLLNQQVDNLTPLSDNNGEETTASPKKWKISTSANEEITCSSVMIAAGTGTFTSRRMRLEEAASFENKSLFYAVRTRETFKDQDLIIAGGGDSALDWTLELLDSVSSLTLIHRRDRFRAAPSSVEKMRAAVEANKMKLVIGDITKLHGNDGILEKITLSGSEGESELNASRILAFYGLQIKLGPVGEWGLELHDDKQIIVDTEKFQTSKEGIFAIGDINWYPGKLRLILSGFHEAALASHAAFAIARPEERLRFQYTTSSSQLQKLLNVT